MVWGYLSELVKMESNDLLVEDLYDYRVFELNFSIVQTN